VRLEGKPLGKAVKQGPNIFVSYNIREMKPHDIKRVTYKLSLERIRSLKTPQLDYVLNEIPDDIRHRNSILASEFATRRLLKTVNRILRKTNNILEIESHILSFINRNIKCYEDIESDPFTIFQRNYGSVEDVSFAFCIMNMLLGIPARKIIGLRFYQLEEKTVLKDYTWAEIFSPDGWVPVDPCRGIILDPSNLEYIPLLVEIPIRKIPKTHAYYKPVITTMRKGLNISEEFLGISVRSNNKCFQGKIIREVH